MTEFKVNITSTGRAFSTPKDYAATDKVKEAMKKMGEISFEEVSPLEKIKLRKRKFILRKRRAILRKHKAMLDKRYISLDKKEILSAFEFITTEGSEKDSPSKP